MPDWKKIKAEYIRGSSYKKLAEKYSVSFSTIQKVGSREKWTDLRKKTSQKMDENLADAVARKEARRLDVFENVTDKLLKIISDGLDDGTLMVTAKGLRDITGALKDIREIKGIKSDVDLQEQLARIEKLRRDTQDDTHDTEVKVVMSDDMEEYAK